MYKTQEALPPRFQIRASWQANLGTLNLLDQFETTSGKKDGSRRWLRTPGCSCVGAVHENSSMDSAADIDDSEDATNLVLVNGSIEDAYTTVDPVGTAIELVPHGMGSNRRPTGQRGF